MACSPSRGLNVCVDNDEAERECEEEVVCGAARYEAADVEAMLCPAASSSASGDAVYGISSAIAAINVWVRII